MFSTTYQRIVSYGAAVLAGSQLINAQTSTSTSETIPAAPPVPLVETNEPPVSSECAALRKFSRYAPSESVSRTVRGYFEDKLRTNGRPTRLPVTESLTTESIAPELRRFAFPERAAPITHTRYGNVGVQRLFAHEAYFGELRSAQGREFVGSRDFANAGKVGVRSAAGFTEALAMALNNDPRTHGTGPIGVGVEAADGLFKELAHFERNLEIRRGVILDLFGDVHQDLEERSHRHIDNSSAFSGNRWSDLDAGNRHRQVITRIGLGGVGVNPERYRVSARIERRLSKNGRLFLSGEARPWLHNEGSFQHDRSHERFSLICGISGRF